jgi:hypothetical protein
MSNPEFPSLAEMGEAGVQFVRQFELRKVLGDFEERLLEVANRKPAPPRAADAEAAQGGTESR